MSSCTCICYHDLMKAYDLTESEAKRVMADPELAEVARGFLDSSRWSEASLPAAQLACDDLHKMRWGR